MGQKKLAVQVDEKLSEQLETYCQVYDTNAQHVIAAALNEYLANRSDVMQQLIQGYQQMASINSEISEAFSACECEAYSHI